MSKGLAGVGNTPAHQYLITYFVLEIYRRFDKYKKYEDYRAYPEFDSEDNKNPDLSIYIRKKPTDELEEQIKAYAQKKALLRAIELRAEMDAYLCDEE